MHVILSTVALLAKCQGDQVNEDEMAGGCCISGQDERSFARPNADGRILLKYILKCEYMETGVIPTVLSCEHGNVHLRSIKSNFLTS
jgi:hypothetical protein